MKMLLIILLLASSCFASDSSTEVLDVDLLIGGEVVNLSNIPQGTFDHFEYICPPSRKLTIEIHNDQNGNQIMSVDCEDK